MPHNIGSSVVAGKSKCDEMLGNTAGARRTKLCGPFKVLISDLGVMESHGMFK